MSTLIVHIMNLKPCFHSGLFRLNIPLTANEGRRF